MPVLSDIQLCSSCFSVYSNWLTKGGVLCFCWKGIRGLNLENNNMNIALLGNQTSSEY